MRLVLAFAGAYLATVAAAQDAAEAAKACIVIHEKSGSEADKSITCFENTALERSAFESGVCRWQTDAQSAADVKTTTHFVAQCPPSYAAYCDRLVLDARTTAPVKIYLYDRTAEVLERAGRHCRSGGGNWHPKADDDGQAE